MDKGEKVKMLTSSASLYGNNSHRNKKLLASNISEHLQGDVILYNCPVKVNLNSEVNASNHKKKKK